MNYINSPPKGGLCAFLQYCGGFLSRLGQSFAVVIELRLTCVFTSRRQGTAQIATEKLYLNSYLLRR